MITFNDKLKEFQISRLHIRNVWPSYDEKSTATDENVKKSFQVVRSITSPTGPHPVYIIMILLIKIQKRLSSIQDLSSE